MSDGGTASSRPGSDLPAGPIDQRIGWGSDVAAQMLRRLDIPYIALTPGASYRGLHDSLVNHLGNERPELVLCLHEEHAVAIAQGYAKATDRPIAVALHANVGLMHASMAIFNAWCDRQPMLIVGATGPVAADRRRPWIDWIHTAQDQGALIRPFIKWDDQPGSVAAIPESFLRGWQIAGTQPRGPVYVCLDAALQETELPADSFALPDVARFAVPAPATPDPRATAAAAEALRKAERPLILFGRGGRATDSWQNRVALAEQLGAAMLSDLKTPTMVPSDHPLHVGQPFNRMPARVRDRVANADVILSLDWIDLGGFLGKLHGGRPSAATIVHAGQDIHLLGGWGKEFGALPPVDIHLLGDPDQAVAALLKELHGRPQKPSWVTPAPAAGRAGPSATLTLREVAAALAEAVGDQPMTRAVLPRGWPIAALPHRDPLAYLGKDGGGGVGAGPGITLGAALALKDSGRLVVGVLGDGDCMMSINALWTAAHHQVPALFVVANNRSYYNDEIHQAEVAVTRSRNPANKKIGLAIDGPAPDFARLAEAQGVAAIGPLTRPEQLPEAMATAVARVRAGQPFLVDVHIDSSTGREASDGAARAART